MVIIGPRQVETVNKIFLSDFSIMSTKQKINACKKNPTTFIFALAVVIFIKKYLEF